MADRGKWGKGKDTRREARRASRESDEAVFELHTWGFARRLAPPWAIHIPGLRPSGPYRDQRDGKPKQKVESRRQKWRGGRNDPPSLGSFRLRAASARWVGV